MTGYIRAPLSEHLGFDLLFLLSALPLMLSLALSACGAVEAQHQKEEQLKVAEATMNRENIYVSASDIPYPKRVLGKLDYSETFSPDAIETSNVNEKLRKIAIERYGDEVDAIIEVHIDVDDTATQVNVAAQAVRITTPCSFCRHKSSDTDAGQVSTGH
jgi:hypothetical protein